MASIRRTQGSSVLGSVASCALFVILTCYCLASSAALVLVHEVFDEHELLGRLILLFDAVGALTAVALSIRALLLFRGYYRS